MDIRLNNKKALFILKFLNFLRTKYNMTEIYCDIANTQEIKKFVKKK